MAITDVGLCLTFADYPKNKGQLINYAKENCNHSIVSKLKKIEEGVYGNAKAVEDEIVGNENISSPTEELFELWDADY